MLIRSGGPNSIAPLDVIITNGQSNDVGQSATADLPITERLSDVRWQGWQELGAPWTNPPPVVWQLSAPLIRYNGVGNPSTALFGPELFLGRRLADFGHRAAIIKYAHGGTSLNGYWRPSLHLEFDIAMQVLDNALTAIGKPYRIRAYVFVGMETDFTLEAVNAVPANLAELIAAVRAHVNVPDLPFIVWRACSEWQRVMIPELQAKQDEFAASDPFTTLINTNGYALIDEGLDTIHYAAGGQRDGGIATADAILSAIS